MWLSSTCTFCYYLHVHFLSCLCAICVPCTCVFCLSHTCVFCYHNMCILLIMYMCILLPCTCVFCLLHTCIFYHMFFCLSDICAFCYMYMCILVSADHPTILGFDPLVNQRLLPPTFPRYTKIKSRLEALEYFEELLNRLKVVCKITSHTSFHSALVSLQ